MLDRRRSTRRSCKSKKIALFYRDAVLMKHEVTALLQRLSFCVRAMIDTVFVTTMGAWLARATLDVAPPGSRGSLPSSVKKTCPAGVLNVSASFVPGGPAMRKGWG